MIRRIMFEDAFHLFFQQCRVTLVCSIDQYFLLIIVYDDAVAIFTGADIKKMYFHTN